MIQISEGDWVFTLDSRKVLTIRGAGLTKVVQHTGMTPDQLQGFAFGWVACHGHMTRDSELEAAKYPVYLPM